MQRLNTFRNSALKLSCTGPVHPHINVLANGFNRKSTFRYIPMDKKPCFDMRNVSIVQGNESHARMISSFLNIHYWPREPSVLGLWMPLDSPYLKVLTDKFSHIGKRLMAMEYQPRIRENRLIGLTVGNRVYPWMISELEQWGHYTDTEPERYRMYFCAHCLKSPNLFAKYKVDYIYDIEVLGTIAEVTGQGVGTFLLKNALARAKERRHPLVQVVAVSKYAARICEKCGMTQVWTMPYRDYVDKWGQSVFFPRFPHLAVSIYVKYFEPLDGGEFPCKPDF